MSPLVIVAWFFLMLALVCISILNVYKICLKLKYGIRITCISPRIQKPYCRVYSILEMTGVSGAMKQERFRPMPKVANSAGVSEP
jgi:hypothetical protein